MINIVAGRGKVHAWTIDSFTLCNRTLAVDATRTDAEVTCKVCAKARQATAPAVSSAPAQADVVLFTGRVRHGAIRHARSLRRQTMRAQVRALSA